MSPNLSRRSNDLPHGTPATDPDIINADLLAFIQG
jgi:hypothetical protein